jgi:hypothetical protein
MMVGALLTGCAGLRPVQLMLSPPAISAQTQLSSVPFYPQDAYQCGPAALAMLLAWSGAGAEPDALVFEVYSPALKGSLQPVLTGAVRRHGRVAYPVHGMEALLREVAAGHPVIVLQNLGLSWYPKWHYAVVTGYDLPAQRIVLHSGVTADQKLSLRVFNNTWAHGGFWGLLVLRPTDLPATAQEQTYLEAVLGLEQARQWYVAAEAYQTAVNRWPASLGAWMGLGNSHYALREFDKAEEAFREAAQSHPDSGAAFNNLAQVLFEQGRREEALAAARQAVALEGPLRDVYQKTLEEIEAGRR